MYSCGTQSELPRERTEKGISKVVSDGEWKPYVESTNEMKINLLILVKLL